MVMVLVGIAMMMMMMMMNDDVRVGDPLTNMSYDSTHKGSGRQIATRRDARRVGVGVDVDVG